MVNVKNCAHDSGTLKKAKRVLAAHVVPAMAAIALYYSREAYVRAGACSTRNTSVAGMALDPSGGFWRVLGFLAVVSIVFLATAFIMSMDNKERERERGAAAGETASKGILPAEDCASRETTKPVAKVVTEGTSLLQHTASGSVLRERLEMSATEAKSPRAIRPVSSKLTKGESSLEESPESGRIKAVVRGETRRSVGTSTEPDTSVESATSQGCQKKIFLGINWNRRHARCFEGGGEKGLSGEKLLLGQVPHRNLQDVKGAQRKAQLKSTGGSRKGVIEGETRRSIGTSTKPDTSGNLQDVKGAQGKAHLTSTLGSRKAVVEGETRKLSLYLAPGTSVESVTCQRCKMCTMVKQCDW